MIGAFSACVAKNATSGLCTFCIVCANIVSIHMPEGTTSEDTNTDNTIIIDQAWYRPFLILGKCSPRSSPAPTHPLSYTRIITAPITSPLPSLIGAACLNPSCSICFARSVRAVATLSGVAAVSMWIDTVTANAGAFCVVWRMVNQSASFSVR